MVFQKPFDGDLLVKINQEFSDHPPSKEKNTASKDKGSASAPGKTSGYNYENDVASVFRAVSAQQKANLVKKLRAHRYEAGMSNAGAYDYAYDVGNNFKDLTLVPVDFVSWGDGTSDPDAATFASGKSGDEVKKKIEEAVGPLLKSTDDAVKVAEVELKKKGEVLQKAKAAYTKGVQKAFKGKAIPSDQPLPPEVASLKEAVDAAQAENDTVASQLGDLKIKQAEYKRQIGSVKVIGKLNMLVRPVSDEFGFEVIGHYRYGRGAFIDRGKIQVDDGSGGVANKLNIQFAATGGLLTDGPTVNTGGPNSQSFSAAFEDMRPEDYLTGAAFDHGTDGHGEVQNITMTGQSTYSSAIMSSKQRTGSAVFTDADATRRGVTLAELKPTLKLGDLSAGIEKCGCQLGKTDWLSVLPQTAIDQILKPFNTLNPNLPGHGTEVNAANNRGEVRFGNPIDRVSTTITGSDSQADDGGNFAPNRQAIDFGSFFNVLSNYLVERFGGKDGTSGDYASNASRELEDLGANLAVENPNNDFADNNILGDPTDPLFQRAANGDPDALEALKQAANFNFGRTASAANKFGPTVQAAIENAEASILGLPQQEGHAFASNPFGVQASVDPQAKQAVSDSQAGLDQAALNLQQAEKFAKDNPNSDFAKQALADAQTAYAKSAADLNRAKAAAGGDTAPSDKQQAIDSYNAAISALNSRRIELETEIAFILSQAPAFILQNKAQLDSLRLELSDVLKKLGIAETGLNASQNGPENVGTIVQTQVIGLPTQGGILNPSKFGPGIGTTRDGTPLA